jgi:hypothetical protein
MKKTIVALLALGLVAGSLSGSAVAGKKKQKLFKGELSFYLHHEGCGEDNTLAYMDLEDKSGDDSCAYIFQPAQEAFVATGLSDPLTWSYAATDGVPFRLKAKKGVKGLLAIGHVGIVEGSVDVRLSGSTKKGSETLVEENLEIGTAPPGTAEIDLDLAIPKKLNGKVFESLSVDVTIRGVAPQAWVSLENPATHITIHSGK